jgi:hypothetical protein
LLDTSGKIDLTLCLLLSLFLDALKELGKLQEISHPKGGPTRGKDHTGIWRNEAGPGCWECPDVFRSLVKGDPIFAPIVPVAEDLKLLAIQGVKGMSYREHSFR